LFSAFIGLSGLAHSFTCIHIYGRGNSVLRFDFVTRGALSEDGNKCLIQNNNVNVRAM